MYKILQLKNEEMLYYMEKKKIMEITMLWKNSKDPDLLIKSLAFLFS